MFQQVPILMYHRVEKVSHDRNTVLLDKFTWQMEYLQKSGYQTISVQQLVRHLTEQALLPAQAIVITFDDGYADNYQYALPVLQQYGLTASVFVVAGWVGRECGWRRPEKRNAMLMSWEQLRAWQSAGMEIGAHTLHHPRLSRLTEEQIREELAGSKQVLEENLHTEVPILCYPYGDFDGRVQRISREVGFTAALGIFEGVSVTHNDLYALRRVGISSRLGNLEFKLKVSRWHPLFIWLRQWEKKLKSGKF